MFDRVRRFAGPLWAIGAIPLLAPSAFAQTATETILYNFSIDDPTTPLGAFGPLKLDSHGALWGIADLGGANGDGALFRFGPNGKVDIIYSIPPGPTDDGYFGGSEPLTKRFRVFDGATPNNGAFGFGSLFTATSQGVGSTLHSFSMDDIGYQPSGHLAYGPDGSIIGTAEQGDGSAGVVWQLSAAGAYTVLHVFTGGVSDGAFPQLGVVGDGAGAFYGTSREGGIATGTSFTGGVAWKLVGTTLTTLHDFTGALSGNTDGAFPHGLLLTHAGALYGTTSFGGIYGDGTLFEIAPDGTYSVLYNFTHDACANPMDRLVRDASGNLYGVSLKSKNHNNAQRGCVFEYQRNGKLRILMSFSDSTPLNGFSLVGGLVIDAAGNLYGTTNSGGTLGGGVLYKLTP